MFAKQSDAKSFSVWRKWAPPCANPNCLTKSLLQSINHRHQGLSIDGQRYCTPECFELAVKGMVREEMNSQGRPAKARSSRLPLGLLLLQRGILTAEQLKLALAEHKASPQLNFGNVVQQLGFATEEQVTSAVAAQWACPVFTLGDKRIENELRIPRQFLELYEMIPVHYSEIDRRLVIAFVSSVQHQVLYTIGHITGCTVSACFVTAREYDSHLNSPSTPFLRDHETVFEQILEPGEMARIIREQVVKRGAERFRVGYCRDYFWSRIWCSEGVVDLLFKVQHD
jgi:hypothetical protein